MDFLTGIASAHIREDHKEVSKKIKIEPGRTFAGFGFSLALSNLPAGFLRWEGPIVLPTDPMIRVDLIPGEKSGPAESTGS